MTTYSRFGEDSEVYIYVDSTLGALCYSCPFDCSEVDPRSRTLHDAAEILEHMEEHMRAGHKVSRAALDKVKAELGQEV